MQATDIYARLATEFSSECDPHVLLARLLDPIVRLSGARAGSVHLPLPGTGALREACALALEPAPPGRERVVVVPLGCRGRVLGELHLSLAADAEIAEATRACHQTVGALLGRVLHDACQERESRQAVAADVHDGIAQTLAFARMRLPLLEQAIAVHDDQAALRYCADVRQSIGTAHTNLRAILAQCRAPMDPAGLKQALESSVRSFREQTRVDLKFDDEAPDLRLSPAQGAQVCLIVQEALANIAKHAGARHAWLKIGQRDDQIEVVVEDDGAGFPAPAPPASPSHFGLDVMRHRAVRLGGGFEIGAREGGGTRLRLLFPSPVAEGVEP